MEDTEPAAADPQAPPQHWTSFKLIIDPVLAKGRYRVYRYDGRHFNIPVRLSALPPMSAALAPVVTLLTGVLYLHRCGIYR